MRKWLWIILVVLALWLMPVGVLADTSQDVIVTAVGWICDSPGGFTLTYISDYEVQVDWVKGLGAENTMVRAAIGRVPTDRTDGMEIYYGDGTTASSWINMETLSDPVYYRAWSETATGVWSPLFAEDQIEGVSMLLWILIFLALGFLAMSLIFKKGYLAFASAGVWIVAGVYCFSRALEYWDVYFSLGFLFMAFVLACSFAPLAWRETTPEGEKAEDPDVAAMREEMESFNTERNQYDFLYSKPKRRSPRLPRFRP